MAKRILLIEDDAAIIEGLSALLTAEHFEIISASDGEKGFLMAKKENPDLIILDIMLPKMNGLEILQALRNSEKCLTPIIMLTSRTEEIDRVMGLEFGADDYIAKPFSTRELVARIKAVLRRASIQNTTRDIISIGSLVIDIPHQEVKKNGILQKLSITEFKILTYFLQHAGIVVTREMLLDEVWGYDAYPTTRTVDNFILSLRKHIEDDPANPKLLTTVHRAGYKFVIP